MPLDNLLPALQVGQLLATAYTAVFAIIAHVPSVAAPTIQHPLPDGHWGPIPSCARSWRRSRRPNEPRSCAMVSLFLFRNSLSSQDEAVAGGMIKDALWDKDSFPMRNTLLLLLTLSKRCANNLVRQEVHVAHTGSIIRTPGSSCDVTF